jgi:hypothetical protein
MDIRRLVGALAIGAATTLVVSCGGATTPTSWSPSTPGAPGEVSIGGTVSGLAGTVMLQNNGGDDLGISANGSFAFSARVPNGSRFNVTVRTQPRAQVCSVANGTGTASGASVSNIGVRCLADSFTVGGTVSGLSGSVVLQNNGADNLTIAANGGFTFPSAQANASQYNVTVLTQPSGQTCTVAHGVGTVSGADVANATVTCATNTFSVGGTVSGLTGTLVLRVNGGNNLSISVNGPFTFATPLADGSPYSVTVLTQPTGQSCSIAGGTGTIPGANVTSVNVSCVANTFTVGGTVSGLSGSVVLQNNGADDLTISVNGGFTFPSAQANASQYNVTVLTQPSGQTCTVANGVGTLSGTNVTNVRVACSTNNPAGGYTTTFPNTENPISEGGNWINTVSATWTAPVSTVGGSPGHAVGLNSTGFNDSIAMLTGSFSPDQSVTATVFRGASAISPAEIELHLRMTMIPGSPDKVFTYEIDVIPGQNEIVIVRWNGAQGNFTNLSSGRISSINDGDVIEATITGPANAAVITVKLNGTTVVTATDTAGYATGNPGIGFDAGNPASGANFGIRSYTATSLGTF